MPAKAKPANAALRWQFAPAAADAGLVDALARTLNLSPIAARLLLRRNIQTAEQAEKFLSRRFDLLHDPMLLPDIQPAIARIAKAVERGERIVLFGDYDVDGITATALLARFFGVLKKK
jgi:single-stranded-DNA-specific exonuclease